MIVEGVQIDLERFITRLGIQNGIQSGDEINADCPWEIHRSGGRRKFYINVKTGFWICQACDDRKGSLTKLVALLKDISFVEAREYIKDNGNEYDFDAFGDHIVETLYGDDGPYRVIEDKKLVRQTRKMVRSSRRFPRTGYWASRGYLERTIRYWNLRILSDSKWPNLIPITVDGKEKYFLRRASKSSVVPKYLGQTGFPRREILFGLDKAQSSTLVLCEGPLDAISLWQHLSIKKALDTYSPVAIFGAYVTEEQARLIERNADRVIFFFDNDVAGMEASEKSFWAIRNVPIYEVNYGEAPAKDPGDLTPKQALKMLDSAESIVSRKIKEQTSGS